MESGCFQLRPAYPADHRTLISLIDQAAGWLRTKGTTQWNRPWPNREERDRRVYESLLRDESWILWDDDVAVATVSLTPTPDAFLWTDLERTEPAVYLHRLVVHRGYAGRWIGSQLLDWAARRARHEHGARWIRIDVWSDNHALHRYYLERGFEWVRQSGADPSYPAGALFQRDTRLVRPRPRPRTRREPAAGLGTARDRLRGEPSWIELDVPATSNVS